MTTRMKVVDDRTGREIPPGARYFNVTISGITDNASYVYRDLRTPAAVVDAVRAALAQSQVRREQYPTLDQSKIRIEIHERTV